jgi:hypothetical protein
VDTCNDSPARTVHDATPRSMAAAPGNENPAMSDDEPGDAGSPRSEVDTMIAVGHPARSLDRP